MEGLLQPALQEAAPEVGSQLVQCYLAHPLWQRELQYHQTQPHLGTHTRWSELHWQQLADAAAL